MGLPGHRRTSSHKRRRAAHFALKALSLTKCQKCQEVVEPHRACRNCGFYKGREVTNTKTRIERSLKKSNALKAAAKKSDSHEGHDHAHEKEEKKESPKS